MEDNVNSGGGMPSWAAGLLGLGCLFLILMVGAAIFFPMLARPRMIVRRSVCQTNLKELALAIHMYTKDYDNKLPSAHSGISDKKFETTLGSVSTSGRADSWASAVRPYLKSSDVYHCPSDRTSPRQLSYHYKHAVNKAAKAGMTTDDFTFPTEQATLYERNSFHWGGAPLADNVYCNVAFIDGHVKTHRFINVFPNAEPKYFGTLDTSNPKAAGMKRPYWDPRYCYDSLR